MFLLWRQFCWIDIYSQWPIIWYWGGIYQNILIIVSITMVIVNINMISYIHHKCQKSHDQPRNLATIIWQILFSSLAVADLLVAILVMPLGAVKEVRSKYISDIDIRFRYRKYLCHRGGIKIYDVRSSYISNIDVKEVRSRYLKYWSKDISNIEVKDVRSKYLAYVKGWDKNSENIEVKEVRSRYISNIDVRSRYLKYWSKRCEIKIFGMRWDQII